MDLNKARYHYRLLILITGILTACNHDPEPHYAVEGITVDSIGKPISNVKLFVSERKSGGLSFFYVQTKTIAEYKLTTDIRGKFSQPINWENGAYVDVSAPYLDNMGYEIASCLAGSGETGCRVDLTSLPGQPTSLTIVMKRGR